VRLQLQEKLDVDLTERKKEVDQLVMEVIDEQTQEDGDEEVDEDSEEEEEKAPVKKKATLKKKAESESGSEFDAEEEKGSDEEASGSDYEPERPIKKAGGKGGKKKKASDGDSSGEEWSSAKKKPASAKKAGGRKKKAADSDGDSDYEKPKKKRKTGGGKGGGYTAPVKLSDELADVVGGNEMPRHEVVKRMWTYIKDNKLQDPKNKQMILCDEKLSKVIPTKKFRGFGMAKFLKDHMNVEGGKAKKPVSKAASGSENDSD